MTKSIFFALALVGLFSCNLSGQATRSVEAADFQNVIVNSWTDVEIYKGAYRVELVGSEAGIERMNVQTKGKTLYINQEKGRKGATVKVTMPNIAMLRLNGSGTVRTLDRFDNLDDLAISVSGSGDVEFAGTARSVDLSVAGSGDIIANDLNMKKGNINVAGSGDVSAGQAEALSISIVGSGDVSVGQAEALNISIAGSGDVSYQGSPKVKKNIIGSGEVNGEGKSQNGNYNGAQ